MYISMHHYIIMCISVCAHAYSYLHFTHVCMYYIVLCAQEVPYK